jgi:hypothetical protein
VFFFLTDLLLAFGADVQNNNSGNTIADVIRLGEKMAGKTQPKPNQISAINQESLCDSSLNYTG